VRNRLGEVWVRHPQPFNGEDTLYYIVGTRKKRYKAINLDNGKLELVREHHLEGARLCLWPYTERTSWQVWWEKVA